MTDKLHSYLYKNTSSLFAQTVRFHVLRILNFNIIELKQSQLRLMELLKCIGADASYQIDICTVDSLWQFKQIVESCGGKIQVHVELPDGSSHGFKL